jgi:hypothetical protein
MMHVAANDARIVLVPGGFTGAWMWPDVAALLEAEEIGVVTVELPTIGEQSAGADFYADAQAVRDVLAFRDDGLAFLDRYARGTEDPMPEAVASGFLERTSEIVELPTGHCPNWSRPDLVERLLAERARSMASERA